jgi:D-alanyl-D-alanine carboxypeptidase
MPSARVRKVLASAIVVSAVTIGLALAHPASSLPATGPVGAWAPAPLSQPPVAPADDIRGPAAAAVTAGGISAPAAAAVTATPAIEPTPGPSAIPSAALTATLGAVRKKYAIPGMEATIIWPDGRSWTAVTGLANIGARVRVVPSTPFAVGSISKTFVAALILKLSEEGRLSLDDPVSRWLSTLQANKVPPTVTIRQLLTHTSGVYDYFSNPLIDPALTSAKRRVWTIARDMLYVRTPYFPAGTGWHYSNTNYIVLGQIAELAGGASVPAQLRARFLGPLRLLSGTYQVVETPKLAVAHAYTFASTSPTAPPIDQSDGTPVAPFTSVTSAAGAAGAIAMSSWDLARWARALYGGTVLRPDSLAQMLDVSATSALGSKPYGFATQQTSLNGWTVVGHGGRLIGSQAVMRYVPQLGVSIAVTTNQWRTSPDAIVQALAAIALPMAPPPPPPLPPSPSPSPSIALTPAPSFLGP